MKAKWLQMLCFLAEMLLLKLLHLLIYLRKALLLLGMLLGLD